VALEQCWRDQLNSFDEAMQSLLEARDYLKAMDKSGFADLFAGFPEKNVKASRKVEQFLAQKMRELEWLADGSKRKDAKEKALEKCKEEVHTAKRMALRSDSLAQATANANASANGTAR